MKKIAHDLHRNRKVYSRKRTPTKGGIVRRHSRTRATTEMHTLVNILAHARPRELHTRYDIVTHTHTHGHLIAHSSQSSSSRMAMELHTLIGIFAHMRLLSCILSSA